MTIKELIERLATYDPEAYVWIEQQDEYTENRVAKDIIEGPGGKWIMIQGYDE